jgi:ABC-type dipeptide/oligopeptide/nickel transport system ATPase subunit
MGFLQFDRLWKRNGMHRDSITIKNVKGFSKIHVDFDYPDSNFIVVTGKNGVGKTTLVKALSLIKDPLVFQKTSGNDSIGTESSVEFSIAGHGDFSFKYSSNHNSLDSKDSLPEESYIVSELPIPYGDRFQHFSLIAGFDNEIRVNIASTEYDDAHELIAFLTEVYRTDKFEGLKKTKIGKYEFYLNVKSQDYYIREDHFSSGEFFLIQLYRLITSKASLVVIDEVDIALDAAVQVNLYAAVNRLLLEYQTRLVVISHSLAFMNTVDDGSLYYLESDESGPSLEKRSFGYIKSDLYGFRGKERYILTEDDVLVGFIEYLVRNYVIPFFQYEIIPIGGQPQIDMIARRNDEHGIFGDSDKVVIFIDKDISEQLKYKGPSKVYCSPVEDIELYLWKNKETLLSDVYIESFQEARREKDTAKTYWKKVIRSKKKTKDELYRIVDENFKEEIEFIVASIKELLCLNVD